MTDVETQCKITAKRSVATQTLSDRKPRKRYSTLAPSPSFQPHYLQNKENAHLIDHNYSVYFSPPELPTNDYIHFLDVEKIATSVEAIPLEEIDSPTSSEADTDEEYICSDTDDSSESEDEGSNEDRTGSDADRKFIVFECQLDQLFKICKKCGSLCDIEKIHKGSMVTVKAVCLMNHRFEWTSQPVHGNVFVSAAVLFTGGTFESANNFAKALNLNFVKKNQFYNFQRTILFPAIDSVYQKQQQDLINRLKVKSSVDLCGDGRSDSPGHSAKYGTYSLMEETSGTIIDFSLVHVSEVSSSNAMEYEGLKRSLDKLISQNVKIRCLTTDRHTQVTAELRKKYPFIVHQYDVWHISKWVTIKLTNKAKQKGNEELFPWIQSISNHLWWSVQTCEGNPELLQEKWVSIINHIADIHEWDEGKHFLKCEHHKLSKREKKRIKFLKPGSPAHVALEEVVMNTRLIKDLSKLTECHHTGNLEVYHSSLLKYAPKREHFSYEGMIARTQLAILDHNCNTARKQAVVKKGQNKGSLKYKVVFPKGRNKWVAKPIPEDKSYSFIADLMESVEAHKQDEINTPPPISVRIPPNIAKTPRPSKIEVINSHKSRMGKKNTKL